MKKSIVFVLITTILLGSCTKETVFGDGPVVSDTRSVNNFTGIAMALPGQVNFKVDPVYKVEIRAQQNIINVIRTNVVNGVLDIDVSHDVRLRNHEDIVINIQAPSADFFRLSGSGDIDAIGDLVTNQLRLELSGSGSIDLQRATVADKINARISGSGNINVSAGSTKYEELRISGSGNMNLTEVMAEKAEVNISGSGDMRVNLSHSLIAHISGSGSVYYKGSPTVSTQVSGSGIVKPL
jgi:hypothetical protein